LRQRLVHLVITQLLMHQALIQQRRVVLAARLILAPAVLAIRQVLRVPAGLTRRAALVVQRRVTLARVDSVALLILDRVQVDLIQVILRTLRRHSLVVALRPVRQALQVQERAGLILRLVQHLIQVL
jgi:hypothetical protein